MVNRRYLRQRRGSSASKGRAFRLRRTAAAFLLLTAALLLGSHLALDTTIERSMEYQGRILASETLAQETLNILSELNLTYGDLATVSRDANGSIVSIETNSSRLNEVKNLLEQRVTQALSARRLHD